MPAVCVVAPVTLAPEAMLAVPPFNVNVFKRPLLVRVPWFRIVAPVTLDVLESVAVPLSTTNIPLILPSEFTVPLTRLTEPVRLPADCRLNVLPMSILRAVVNAVLALSVPALRFRLVDWNDPVALIWLTELNVTVFSTAVFPTLPPNETFPVPAVIPRLNAPLSVPPMWMSLLFVVRTVSARSTTESL